METESLAIYWNMKGREKVYEKLQRLLDARGITAYQLAKETGIASARFSEWKRGRCKPKADKLQKIAEYFGVTIEYFLE